MGEEAFTPIVTRRYARGLDVAAVVVVVGWHLGGAGPLMLAHLDEYRVPGVHLAAWVGVLAVIVVAAIRLMCRPAGRRAGPVLPWLLVGATALLALSVARFSVPGRFLETDWGWGSCGWAGVLLLLHRPLRELVWVLALLAVETLAVMGWDGSLTRPELAGFVTVLYASASIQIAVAITTRALDGPARQAAAMAIRQAEAAARRAIAERLHDDRKVRYAALRRSLQPLLRGLASRELSPADPWVRRQCAIEASRLRRLIAESDDVPDPLVHELSVCVDDAGRRRVAASVHQAGVIPAVPTPARRALAEIVIGILASGCTHARITIVGDEAGVSVAVVADPDTDVPEGTYPGLIVSRQRTENELWTEARWNVP
ncbi:hypothetical protein AB0O28_01180 [Microbispora sp. NPDC088329]|uniref:hypothetical protein n=1 Tax=Microbispora sp. NPDC088329 TaxID=3154869 RepID=UPI003419F6BB